MAALSSPRNTDQIGTEVMVNRIAIPIAASVVIWQGALVQTNASGLATPAGTATTADTSAFKTWGMAYQTYNNAAGAASALTVEVEPGYFTWDIGAAADALVQADIGIAVYAIDDHTVGKTSGTSTRAIAGIFCGLIVLPELGTQAIVQTLPGVV